MAKFIAGGPRYGTEFAAHKNGPGFYNLWDCDRVVAVYSGPKVPDVEYFCDWVAGQLGRECFTITLVERVKDHECVRRFARQPSGECRFFTFPA